MSFNETRRHALAVIPALPAVAVAVLTACADPTAPASHPNVLEPRQLPAQAAQTAGGTEQGYFSDVLGRILPSISDRFVADQLSAKLGDLEAASRAGNRPAAVALIKKVRELFERSDAHPSNIGAMRVAMQGVEELLALPETDESEANAEHSTPSP